MIIQRLDFHLDRAYVSLTSFVGAAFFGQPHTTLLFNFKIIGGDDWNRLLEPCYMRLSTQVLIRAHCTFALDLVSKKAGLGVLFDLDLEASMRMIQRKLTLIQGCNSVIVVAINRIII